MVLPKLLFREVVGIFLGDVVLVAEMVVFKRANNTLSYLAICSSGCSRVP